MTRIFLWILKELLDLYIIVKETISSFLLLIILLSIKVALLHCIFIPYNGFQQAPKGLRILFSAICIEQSNLQCSPYYFGLLAIDLA